MLTVEDLKGKPIPQGGICPICFDQDRRKTHEWKNLRIHLINSHGMDPYTHNEKAIVNTRNQQIYKLRARIAELEAQLAPEFVTIERHWPEGVTP